MNKFETAEVARARLYIKMDNRGAAARSLTALHRAARTSRSQHAIGAVIAELVPDLVIFTGTTYVAR